MFSTDTRLQALVLATLLLCPCTPPPPRLLRQAFCTPYAFCRSAASFRRRHHRTFEATHQIVDNDDYHAAYGNESHVSTEASIGILTLNHTNISPIMHVSPSRGIGDQQHPNGTTAMKTSPESPQRNAWSSPGPAAFDFRSTLTSFVPVPSPTHPTD